MWIDKCFAPLLETIYYSILFSIYSTHIYPIQCIKKEIQNINCSLNTKEKLKINQSNYEIVTYLCIYIVIANRVQECANKLSHS